MRLAIATAAVATTLSGCAQPDRDGPAVPQPGARSVLAAFSAVPFQAGAVRIVAPAPTEMRTFVLVPCSGGTAICDEDIPGRLGQLRVEGGQYIVTGLYPDHIFYLSPGGNGRLVVGPYDLPLAWD